MNFTFSFARKLLGEEPFVFNKGGGGSSTPANTTNTTTTKVEPWEAAQGDLKEILNLAKQEFERSGGLSGQWVDQNLADLTPEMKKSLQDLASSGQLVNIADHVNDNLGSVQDAITQAQKDVTAYGQKNYDITGDQINNLASQLYDSELVQSQKSELASTLAEKQAGDIQALNQAATSAGGMGSSRAGVTQGYITSKSAENLSKGTADILNSARTNAQTGAIGVLQGNQSVSAQQDANTLSGRLSNINSLLGLESQRTQNASLAANLYNQQLSNQNTAAQLTQQRADAAEQLKYQNAVNKQNAGWQNLSNYQGMVSQIAGQGSSSSGTAVGQSAAAGPSTAQSAIGGALSGAASGALIGNVVPGVGTAIGAVGGGILGGLSGLFSDAEMKDNVKAKGKTKSGDIEYEWDYKNKKKKGKKSTGVLAQNVAAKNPDAVSSVDGALAVNYDKTSIKPKNGKKVR